MSSKHLNATFKLILVPTKHQDWSNTEHKSLRVKRHRASSPGLDAKHHKTTRLSNIKGTSKPRSSLSTKVSTSCSDLDVPQVLPSTVCTILASSAQSVAEQSPVLGLTGVPPCHAMQSAALHGSRTDCSSRTHFRGSGVGISAFRCSLMTEDPPEVPVPLGINVASQVPKSSIACKETMVPLGANTMSPVNTREGTTLPEESYLFSSELEGNQCLSQAKFWDLVVSSPLWGMEAQPQPRHNLYTSFIDTRMLPTSMIASNI